MSSQNPSFLMGKLCRQNNETVMAKLREFVISRSTCDCANALAFTDQEGDCENFEEFDENLFDEPGVSVSEDKEREQQTFKQLNVDGCGDYYICRHGIVFSTKSHSVKVLTNFYNKHTRCLSVSFGNKTRGVAKLVLEHFDPEFAEKGGKIMFKNRDHRDVRFDNLTYQTFDRPGEKEFWESYYKVRWDAPQGVPETLAKAFFEFILDSTSVHKYCEGFCEDQTPTPTELEAMYEAGWASKYEMKRHGEKGIPLGLTKALLDYLSGAAKAYKGGSISRQSTESVIPTIEQITNSQSTNLEDSQETGKAGSFACDPILNHSVTVTGCGSNKTLKQEETDINNATSLSSRVEPNCLSTRTQDQSTPMIQQYKGSKRKLQTVCKGGKAGATSQVKKRRVKPL